MTQILTAHPTSIAVAAALALFALTAGPAIGATAKKPAHEAKAAAKKAAEPALEPAGAEQIDAAERVYYGVYDCEFKQTVDIVASQKYPGYVEVKHAKADYLMKPVLSSTGAVRLEDVRGETLMVQIATKSMLLNVKTAHRLVDDCVSPKQREMIAAADAAKAQVAARAAPSAEGAASPPTPTATPTK